VRGSSAIRPGGFLDEVHRLYGFAVDGIDYDRPLELDLPWPLAR
jgi:enoyl-[acyl-carrier protein] reductase/trans-2-enoyl-CoA reductase (NAD+)